MTTATPSKTTGTSPAPSKVPQAKVPPLGRPVVWLGLAAGTAITVLAVVHGIRIPGLEVVLSVIVTWLLLMVLAATVAELARRHHRAAARHAWRHSTRAASWTWGHVTAKAADRWQKRQHRPAGPFTPVLLTAHSTCGRVLNPVTGEPHATVLVKDPEDLKRRLAAVARYPDIEVSTRPPDPPGGNESNPPEGTTTMPDTNVTDHSREGWDKPLPGERPRPARRTRNSGSGAVPAEWGGVIARAADCEPDNDGELLGWMGDEVNGVHGYAESLIELLETCTSVIGLDPVAMAALHDVADAATECAAAMAAARHRFADHYELPREFAGNGGLMPHDGRWIKGDGDA